MKKYNERDVYNHLYIKIFNEEIYEKFPDLGKYIKEDYFMVTGFLEDFLIDLYDDSKSVIRPFLDERTTYAYRMHYGIGNFGFSVSNSFINSKFDSISFFIEIISSVSFFKAFISLIICSLFSLLFQKFGFVVSFSKKLILFNLLSKSKFPPKFIYYF